jgi:hypothetical protein
MADNGRQAMPSQNQPWNCADPADFNVPRTGHQGPPKSPRRATRIMVHMEIRYRNEYSSGIKIGNNTKNGNKNYTMCGKI